MILLWDFGKQRTYSFDYFLSFAGLLMTESFQVSAFQLGIETNMAVESLTISNGSDAFTLKLAVLNSIVHLLLQFD